MKTKYKIAYEQALSGITAVGSFVALYYFSRTVMHATTRQTLYIIIPAAIFAIPAYILGNVIGFRKYYIRRDHGVILDPFERGVLVQLAIISFIAGNVLVILYIGVLVLQKYPTVTPFFLLPAVALIWVIIKSVRKLQKYLHDGNISESGIMPISMSKLFSLSIYLIILAILMAAAILWGMYLLTTAKCVGSGLLLLVLGASLYIGILKVAAWGVRTFGIPDSIDTFRRK